METEKKLDAMAEELKLMKGELKQTLSSVRDYLLNMELPSSEFSSILAALGDSEQSTTMKGTFSLPPEGGSGDGEEESSKPEDELSPDEGDTAGLSENEEESSELSPAEEDVIASPENEENESELSPEDEPVNQDENLEPEANLPIQEEAGEPAEDGESPTPEPELSIEEEQLMEYEDELSKSIPKVSLLANLINWIARVKKEIGTDQLPAFLEVYGVSGHLSPELKEVIMNLSEIVSAHPDSTSKAEIWSQSMLALHGILTGSDAPLYPIKPSWDEISENVEPNEEEIIEVDKSKEEAPVKLKLVFPSGDGKNKEYCIDLAPEVDNNGS
jgi:hypothetical protein